MRGAHQFTGHAKAWPKARCDELRHLCAEEMSYRDIGAVLGVTKNAVIGMAHRLKITNGRPSGNNLGPGTGLKRTRAAPNRINSVVANLAPNPVAKPVVIAPKRPVETVTLFALTPYTCRWPYGHPRDIDFGFCGCLCEPQVPYCRHHMALAYRPPQPRVGTPGPAFRRVIKNQGVPA